MSVRSTVDWAFEQGAGREAGSAAREELMKTFSQSIKRFLESEDGPTAVEYAVMLALIVVVCLTAIQAIGTNANTKFEQVKDALT